MTNTEEYLNHNDLKNLQHHKFQNMLKAILPTNQFYQNKFTNAQINTNKEISLKELPFTTKEELIADQQQNPPYGTFLTYPLSHYTRLHQTSGSTGNPLKYLDTRENWLWFFKCWEIIYRATGLSKSDWLFFPFSFGPFIGFWAAFESAQNLGNMCLPGGGMTTLGRLQFLQSHPVTYICCTPTYALRMAQVAKENKVDIASLPVKALIVAGEPGGAIAAIRNQIETAWQARVFDHTGMTEIGSLGIECLESPGYTHLIESECIPEVINPETLEILSEGQEGELVLTNLGRWGSPLIRYRTGDIVKLTYEPCPCKRNYCRMIGGILSRRDNMIFIRGNNVYPSAIENLIREFPEIIEFRATITTIRSLSELSIEIEIDSQLQDTIIEKISNAIHSRFHFRVPVQAVPKNTLPRFEMKSKRFIFTAKSE